MDRSQSSLQEQLESILVQRVHERTTFERKMAAMELRQQALDAELKAFRLMQCKQNKHLHAIDPLPATTEDLRSSLQQSIDKTDSQPASPQAALNEPMLSAETLLLQLRLVSPSPLPSPHPPTT